MGHGESKRQTPTWSYPSHHRDHYLSKDPGEGGGRGVQCGSHGFTHTLYVMLVTLATCSQATLCALGRWANIMLI